MSDMSEAPKPQPWARKGETVTCVNGHPICDIAHDIYVGDRRSGEDFCNWRQPEPERKARIGAIRCAQCRGAWIRALQARSYQLHFGADKHGGWR